MPTGAADGMNEGSGGTLNAAGPGTASYPVAIVGGGPVGLTLALALARQGVRSVLWEGRGTVSDGSRALGMSRRTQDIWTALGIGDAVETQGSPWYGGWTFFRGRQVLEYRIPHDPALHHPPMLNLSQSHAEAFLSEQIERSPLIDLCWRHRLTALDQDADGVSATVESDAGVEAVRCGYLVACDGARSKVRSALGLRMEGLSGEAHYLIVDIKVAIPLEMGRRAWFDPPTAPGGTVLMHGQPDDTWRIDWQIAPDEDLDALTAPDNIAARVSAHLAMLGVNGAWSVVWVSTYRAHARTLPDYRAGRVVLAGDAAHLIPIFGIRGLNSGVEDAWNLAWKLALAVRNEAPVALVQSYSTERVAAARENLRLATRAMRFMTPPTRGWRTMRDAVLSLGLTQPAVQELINPRQATLLPLEDSPLSSFPERSAAMPGGPTPGEVLPNLRVERALPTGWQPTALQQCLGAGFTLLALGDATAPQPACSDSWQVITVARQPGRGTEIIDPGGQVHQRLCPGPSAFYLIRPDHHIAARWEAATADEVRHALAIATCAAA